MNFYDCGHKTNKLFSAETNSNICGTNKYLIYYNTKLFSLLSYSYAVFTRVSRCQCNRKWGGKIKITYILPKLPIYCDHIVHLSNYVVAQYAHKSRKNGKFVHNMINFNQMPQICFLLRITFTIYIHKICIRESHFF
jgi:hypothetical protein